LETKLFQRGSGGTENGFRNKFLGPHKNLRRGEGKKQPVFGVPVTGVTAEPLQLQENTTSWEDSTMHRTSYSLQDNNAGNPQKPEST